ILLLGFQALIFGDVYLRQDFKCSLETQWLAFLQVEAGDLWLRNWRKLRLGDFFAEVLRDERFNDFRANVFHEAAADDGDWDFSGAESGNAGQLLELAFHTINLFCDDLCR